MKEHKLLYGGRIKPEPFKRDFIRLDHLEQNVPYNTCLCTSWVCGYPWMEQECLPADGHRLLQPQGADLSVSATYQKGYVLVRLSLRLLEYKTEAGASEMAMAHSSLPQRLDSM